jgi:hypothetical protein
MFHMRRKISASLCLAFSGIFFISDAIGQDVASRGDAQPTSSSRILHAMQKTVRGTVADDNGTAISGVSVTIKKTSIGTVTDAKGAFSLLVSDEHANDSLLFSSVGFDEQTVAIADRAVFNIVLSQNVSTLNQVVVVGYGTQRRTAVTAAIASVPMKEIRDMPVSNVAGKGTWFYQRRQLTFDCNRWEHCKCHYIRASEQQRDPKYRRVERRFLHRHLWFKRI